MRSIDFHIDVSRYNVISTLIIVQERLGAWVFKFLALSKSLS